MHGNRNSESGFTLVELTFVIMIIGLLTVPLVVLYQSMVENKIQEDTRTRLKEMNGQMSAYFETRFTGNKPTPHYPCPSDRALAPNDPSYRKEFNGGNCTLAALQAAKGLVYLPLPVGNPPVCTANFGFCIVQGFTDKDGTPGPDPVLIGGVPIRDTLPNYVAQKAGDPFPESDVLDGWGSNFTYAVSYNLVTYSDTYTKNGNGVITVIDENNQPTAGINNDAHYIVVSNGKNRRGGYSASGAIAIPCGAPAAALDNENCNNDYIFRSALGSFHADTASYFDDYLVAYSRHNSGIWEAVGSTGSVHNLNTKFVGIGTASPTAKLDVNGDIRADYNALSGSLCKKDPVTGNAVDCFDVNAITGTGVIQCPNAADPANYTVMQGIKNGRAVCAPPPAGAAKATTITCPPGQFINRINISTGEPKCIN